MIINSEMSKQSITYWMEKNQFAIFNELQNPGVGFTCEWKTKKIENECTDEKCTVSEEVDNFYTLFILT